MLVKLLKSKLHRATVTDTKLHYPGSIAIEPVLMEAAAQLMKPKDIVIIMSFGFLTPEEVKRI
jgi:aspartate 1-decarboxylase